LGKLEYVFICAIYARMAAAASGNPRGILHIRLSAGIDSLQCFLLASYGHALALLDEKLPIDGIARAECGEL
jgi:tRNA 5-methylaminomethyl-2-thiouridine biosynthesis bifunctional protein